MLGYVRCADFEPLAGEEWKVMGLAAYGRSDLTFCDLLRPLLRVNGLHLERGCDPDMLRGNLKKVRDLAREAGTIRLREPISPHRASRFSKRCSPNR